MATTAETPSAGSDEVAGGLIQQMEKNYELAQRVHQERARREEAEHFAQGLRQQMQAVTSRAIKTARELEKEKARCTDLHRELAKLKKRVTEAHLARSSTADSTALTRGMQGAPEIYSDDFDEEEEEEEEESSIPLRENMNGSTGRKSRKKRRKRRKKRQMRPSTATARGRSDALSEGINTRMLSKSTSQDHKMKIMKKRNLDLFKRLANSKRETKAALSDSDAKSEQLRALSDHLEKMMALLRAEAAAKASAEEALRVTEDELALAKTRIAELTQQLQETRLSRKDEMKRDSMLSKQLELMDSKYATLLRTNNFNRAKEAREAKELRSKMHKVTEEMHHLLRRAQDAETASRNTAFCVAKLISRMFLLDRTPFTVAMQSQTGALPLGAAPGEIMVIDMQDCGLGDEGSLNLAEALNSFVAIEAEREEAVQRMRSRNLGMSDGSSPSSSVLHLIGKRQEAVPISLNLSFNNITDDNNAAVVKSLCRSIVATHSITELDLRGNEIGPVGLKMILDALQYNERVRAVDLSGNHVGDADLIEYINSSKHESGLPKMAMIADGGARSLRKITALEVARGAEESNRLRRHKMKSGARSSIAHAGAAVPASSMAAAQARRTRPKSAPASITSRKTLLQQAHTDGSTQNQKRELALPTIDFAPSTSAVNAVQRIILDSVTRLESRNPYRRPQPATGTSEEVKESRSKSSEIPPTRRPIRRKLRQDRMLVPGDSSAEDASLDIFPPPSSGRAATAPAGGSRLGKSASESVVTRNEKPTLRARLRLPPKRAESVQLLRTAAGMTPAEREEKQQKEEEEKRAREREQEMLHEALHGDRRGQPRPEFGGQYAHEIFWPAFSKARAGDYSAVCEYLNKGMPVEAREPETGNSLLMCSAYAHSEILIRMLVRKGGRLAGRSNNGWTALHHCIASGTSHLYIADLLIERGSRTEARDAQGVTPLQLAVEQGSHDAICRLIEAGADICTEDDAGRTVLHRCAAGT